MGTSEQQIELQGKMMQQGCKQQPLIHSSSEFEDLHRKVCEW